jgi:hypothetical protein
MELAYDRTDCRIHEIFSVDPRTCGQVPRLDDLVRLMVAASVVYGTNDSQLVRGFRVFRKMFAKTYSRMSGRDGRERPSIVFGLVRFGVERINVAVPPHIHKRITDLLPPRDRPFHLARSRARSSPGKERPAIPARPAFIIPLRSTTAKPSRSEP